MILFPPLAMCIPSALLLQMAAKDECLEDEGLPISTYRPPGSEQPIYLCLAFNRGLESDVARLNRLAVGGAYVISCSHNEQATSGVRGPEHINSKFGSSRFIKTVQDHFAEMIGQPTRIDTIFLDWHWLQSGGDHWVLGYLSGAHGSKAYHLLKTSIPELVKIKTVHFEYLKDPRYSENGACLQHVYLPIDAPGLMTEALHACRKELVAAGLGLELIKWEDRDKNPLYNATSKVDALVKARSSKGYGTKTHLELYCHRVFPFAHLYATRDGRKNGRSVAEIWDEQLHRLSANSPSDREMN